MDFAKGQYQQRGVREMPLSKETLELLDKSQALWHQAEASAAALHKALQAVEEAETKYTAAGKASDVATSLAQTARASALEAVQSEMFGPLVFGDSSTTSAAAGDSSTTSAAAGDSSTTSAEVPPPAAPPTPPPAAPPTPPPAAPPTPPAPPPKKHPGNPPSKRFA
jgi:hypothetical protein